MREMVKFSNGQMVKLSNDQIVRAALLNGDRLSLGENASIVASTIDGTGGDFCEVEKPCRLVCIAGWRCVGCDQAGWKVAPSSTSQVIMVPRGNWAGD